MLDTTLSAAVLAGGQSSRMGHDKAMIELGGVTVLQRVVQVLRGLVSDVTIIGERSDYQRLDVSMVPDDVPGLGPLGGIATAIRHARNEHVLVVACDMPLLSPRLLTAMASEPRTYDVLIPVRRDERGGIRREPMHAIYARSCLPAIEAQLEAGEVRTYVLFDRVNTRVLDEAWMRRFDPMLESFTNMNTPDELEQVRRVLHGTR